MITGAVIASIGIILVILSLMPTIVTPSQSLMVNSFGILIYLVGVIVMGITTISESKRVILGAGLALAGIFVVFLSFGIADPWTQLTVNSFAILASIIGGALIVHQQKMTMMVKLGITIILIGAGVMIYTLLPNTVPSNMVLTINTIGLMISATGIAGNIKKS